MKSFLYPGLLWALPLFLLAGCARQVDDELFLAVSLEQLRLMFEEQLPPERALEQAAERNGTSVEAVREFQQELERDPAHLKAVQDRLNRATEELFTPLDPTAPLVPDRSDK